MIQDRVFVFNVCGKRKRDENLPQKRATRMTNYCNDIWVALTFRSTWPIPRSIHLSGASNLLLIDAEP